MVPPRALPNKRLQLPAGPPEQASGPPPSGVRARTKAIPRESSGPPFGVAAAFVIGGPRRN
jgi:hypothetical protein